MNKNVTSSIEEIIEDLKNGKMVIMVDDEDRENEGDLIIPAAKADADAVNFMATHGRGLICLTLTADRVKKLNLPLMAQNNQARDATAFTISIESVEGVTTGISAQDRATTIASAIDPLKGQMILQVRATCFLLLQEMEVFWLELVIQRHLLI